MFDLVIIFAIGVGLLAAIVGLQMHVVLKFLIAIVAMFTISKILSKRLGIKDDLGMLMIKSQAGVELIRKAAGREWLWKLFADLGTVIAYGALSYFIIKRPPKERAAVLFAGLVFVSAISIFVAPTAFQFLLTLIGGGEGIASKAGGGNNLLSYASTVLLYLGGLALVALSSLLIYAYVVASAVIGTVFFGTGALAGTAPGATLILPGINIPLVEGIVALALILAVHEGAHAILSVIAKVRILSSGVVLMGVVPIGAFVEPDEEALQKTSAEKQTRVLVAGSSANFFAAIALFMVFVAFLFAAAPYREIGILLVGGNHSGEVVYTINGQPAAAFLNATNVSVNQTLVFEGSKGSFELTLKDSGGLRYYDLASSFLMAHYASPWLMFIYNLLGLAFSLNVVVGMVNLLPIPLFDGYRLLEVNVQQKKVVAVISWIAIIAFLVNFLPWIV
ncbi:MAG: site-2 protease family protein [Candidatus Micrarchaeia archaeon]